MIYFANLLYSQANTHPTSHIPTTAEINPKTKFPRGATLQVLAKSKPWNQLCARFFEKTGKTLTPKEQIKYTNPVMIADVFAQAVTFNFILITPHYKSQLNTTFSLSIPFIFRPIERALPDNLLNIRSPVTWCPPSTSIHLLGL